MENDKHIRFLKTGMSKWEEIPKFLNIPMQPLRNLDFMQQNKYD